MLLWMVLTVRWWKDMISIQYCIAAVMFLGLVESFLWWIFFSEWNSSGERGKVTFVLAIISGVMKSAFSYMLVLVASLGWGVTKPFLDDGIRTRIKIVSGVF